MVMEVKDDGRNLFPVPNDGKTKAQKMFLVLILGNHFKP